MQKFCLGFLLLGIIGSWSCRSQTASSRSKASVEESEIKVKGAAAHWVNAEEILWRLEPKATRFLLLSSSRAAINFDAVDLALTDPAIQKIELIPNAAISAQAQTDFPHLSGFRSFHIAATARVVELVKSQLVAVALDARDHVLTATQLQLGGVLDQEFAYEGHLGLALGKGSLVKLWAPTAQSISLNIYERNKTLRVSLPMHEHHGVWSAPLQESWVREGLLYRFALQVYHPISHRIESYEVTDPYAVSGSSNGAWSQLLDLDDPLLKPVGWDSLRLAAIPQPTDHVYYELHIRDFSSRDLSVPPHWRGSYRAFTLNGMPGRPLSSGMKHLKELQAAGLTHVQVLPAYDFGSVEEDARKTLNLDSSFAALCAFLPAGEALCQENRDQTIATVFSALPKNTSQIANLNAALSDRDSFNWGYDPVHYGMPEGSYSDPADREEGSEGEARVLEFRRMAMSLAEVGLHLAMDVVYNHSYASGLAPFSVLDKVVPGYYHRLDPLSGAVERSSCCENTASERVMMEKLMIDTLKRWNEAYHVDAFRFDLMGLHFKKNMQHIQAALGPEVYIFGEGWSMGELASDVRQTLSARQINLAGTGLGSFNDRFRDAVRGGGPFDCGVQLYQQSPVNGLAFDDNGRGGLLSPKPGAVCTDALTYEDAGPTEKNRLLLLLQDRLRLGLAATLRDYTLIDSAHQAVKGAEIDYYGQAAGYAAEPREIINYIENHDNQTFWDISQLKLPYQLTLAERVRVHNLGLSLNMLAMGVPYFEMGAEFLRSKSLVRDSYNAGDWYNQIDWSFERSNWNSGLPPADKDGNNLGVIRALYDNVPLAPERSDVLQAVAAFKDLLAIRKDSILFRLPSAAEIMKRLDFLPGSEDRPGLIAMRIRDEVCEREALDPQYSEIVVIFNMRPEVTSIPYGKRLNLHPVQAQGQDALVKQAKADGLTITVPGRTTAVFVERRLKQKGMCQGA